ncbi:hypothetical protein INT47_007684 [Mucor saturninus]|uniref:Uncharacterized protein n=1 Tax=Mucor saturninus TaxID=64648 RepID=A0A8H7QJA4_9FUNG|nr:hypothetical protein INT47_007684 [Mucor saturninus]
MNDLLCCTFCTQQYKLCEALRSHISGKKSNCSNDGNISSDSEEDNVDLDFVTVPTISKMKNTPLITDEDVTTRSYSQAIVHARKSMDRPQDEIDKNAWIIDKLGLDPFALTCSNRNGVTIEYNALCHRSNLENMIGENFECGRRRIDMKTLVIPQLVLGTAHGNISRLILSVLNLKLKAIEVFFKILTPYHPTKDHQLHTESLELKNRKYSLGKLLPEKRKYDSDIIDTIVCPNLAPLIHRSPYRNMLMKLHHFNLNDVAVLLNTDWMHVPQIKFDCAQVLAGAILLNTISGDAILLNTIEVYGRTKNVDIHHEISTPKDSTPSSIVITISKRLVGSSSLVLNLVLLLSHQVCVWIVKEIPMLVRHYFLLLHHHKQQKFTSTMTAGKRHKSSHLTKIQDP